MSSVYITNFSPGLSAENLKQFLGILGAISDISKRGNHWTVTFEDPETVNTALLLTGTELMGMPITISKNSPDLDPLGGNEPAADQAASVPAAIGHLPQMLAMQQAGGMAVAGIPQAAPANLLSAVAQSAAASINVRHVVIFDVLPCHHHILTISSI